MHNEGKHRLSRYELEGSFYIQRAPNLHGNLLARIQLGSGHGCPGRKGRKELTFQWPSEKKMGLLSWIHKELRKSKHKCGIYNSSDQYLAASSHELMWSSSPLQQFTLIALSKRSNMKDKGQTKEVISYRRLNSDIMSHAWKLMWFGRYYLISSQTNRQSFTGWGKNLNSVAV